MSSAAEFSARRRKLLSEIARLADVAIFGTLSETYRTCGRPGCHCQKGGPKHGPHLNVSYRGEKGKTTGYYVPKGAEEATREGVAAWQKLQEYRCSATANSFPPGAELCGPRVLPSLGIALAHGNFSRPARHS